MVLNVCKHSLENQYTSERSNWSIMALNFGSKIITINPFSSSLNSLIPDAVISLRFDIVYVIGSR